MTSLDGTELHHGYADLGEVRLHYVEAGSGPLVVLLHGFPEFWYGWRSQIPALARAGFRVVAPDMRGYNLSSKPKGVAAYDTDHLAADVRDLIRERGAERALIAGHDWGAAVAWVTAMNHPDVVERLAIVNVPHPGRFLRALRRSPSGTGCATARSRACRCTSTRGRSRRPRSQPARATRMSSKNSPARRPVLRLTWRRRRCSSLRPARSRICG